MKLITLKDVLNHSPIRSNAYGKVRDRARTRYGHMTACEKCGYDIHVEVCHIKPVSMFPDEASIDEINDRSNVKILCRNCHWEFDHIDESNPYRKGKRPTNNCPICNRRINIRAKKCRSCANKQPKPKKEKINWPSKEELLSLLYEHGNNFESLSRALGVTGNAIRKRICVHN